jgi:hypothetical protein
MRRAVALGQIIYPLTIWMVLIGLALVTHPH